MTPDIVAPITEVAIVTILIAAVFLKAMEAVRKVFRFRF